MVDDNQTGGILKQRIEVLHIHILVATAVEVGLRRIRLGQFEGHIIALLFSDVLIDALHLGRVDKGTLHTDRLRTAQIEHITLTDQLLGTSTVEDGLRVNAGTHLEGDTGGEVGFDITGDDGRRRTLGGDDHMDTHGTGQLGDTGDRQLNLLAGGHNQITELIDDHHDIWHIPVTTARRDLTVDELPVVLLDISGTHLLQQVVAGIHQLTERVQRPYHLRHVGDDGIGIVIGHLRQEMVDQRIVDRELHLLRVHEHDLQLCGVLLI